MGTGEKSAVAPTYARSAFRSVAGDESLSALLTRRHFVLQDERPEGFEDVDLARLDPPLRALLFTDGTVTRALEAHTLSRVTVEVMSQSQRNIVGPTARYLAVSGGTAAIRRRVRIGVGDPTRSLIWADSHIVPDRLPDGFLEVLGGAPDGIGESLQQVRLESWREMLWFGLGTTPAWADGAQPGDHPALTRLYRVISNERPALLIAESFGVRLRDSVYTLSAPH